MPDLSADVVAAWLYEKEPVIAAELRASVPSADEHESVLPAVLGLGKAIDDALANDPDNLRIRLRDTVVLAKARTALAQIGLGRRLRLLHWLSEIPDFGDLPTALLGTDTSEAAQFLRAEIRNLHRRTLLDRMFSPERIAALLDACSAAR
jgi:hypothetical protein